MGRAYSTPEVMEAEGGFYIGRIANPDDEFATLEVVCHDGEGLNDYVCWGELPLHEPVSLPDVVMFGRRSVAEQALAFFRLGQDSVRAKVVYE